MRNVVIRMEDAVLPQLRLSYGRGDGMKFIIKGLLQTLWVVVFFVAALVTKSTLSIVGLGILGLLYSFGFGIARQLIDEVTNEED